MEIKIPALNPSILDDDEQYNLILGEIKSEVSNLGEVKQVVIPRTIDLMQTTTVKVSAIGKAFVEFEEVASAFACYNLLNGRPYRGFPVVINFFNKDLFLTKSLH